MKHVHGLALKKIVILEVFGVPERVGEEHYFLGRIRLSRKQ
jgi:hypothetical protein